MIELLGALVLLLCQDALSVEDVIARIGSVANDPGVPMPIEIRPGPGLRTASLARYADTGLPYLLSIEPELTSRPTVAALKRAFGDYHRVRNDRGKPIEILFNPPIAAKSWKVVLIAEIFSHERDLESDTAISVALRRDPVPSGASMKTQNKVTV